MTLLVTVPSAELAESLRPLPDGVLDGTPLPSLGRVNETSPVSEISPTRAARARKAAASRRPATRNSQNAAEPAKPRPLAVQLLAAGLVQRIPWLDRSGAHIGHVCDLVVLPREVVNAFGRREASEPGVGSVVIVVMQPVVVGRSASGV